MGRIFGNTEFEAKLESFFCHEPRSNSPLSEGFATGAGTDGVESDAAGADSFFRGLSGAFFFEAADPAELGMMEQHVQCQ